MRIIQKLHVLICFMCTPSFCLRDEQYARARRESAHNRLNAGNRR
jgi:hypothetical protein